MQELLEYAERRLEEEIKNSTESEINYWRGYIDAVKRAEEKYSNENNNCHNKA